MELQFLGTGAGVPAKHRNVSGIALSLVSEINEVWLFDAGEGTQLQILRTNIRPRKIKKIFLTHLHGDHLFGLPGLLSSRSFQGGDEPLDDLEIYGPIGVKEFVQTSLRLSQSKLGYKIHFHELTEGGLLFDNKSFKVETLPLEHGILSFGFRITEKDHEGALQVEKLRELGIESGPIYGQIKAGRTIALDDGRVIDGKDFIGEKKKGRVITILGDTRKTKNAEILAYNADVLVHEATFEQGQEKMARRYFHSTNIEAASVAKDANVKKLLLTHISARYMIHDQKELEKQARTIFPNTHMVKDLEEVDIPFEN
ncbi:MAG: ribonuclease Z [Streptococcaceae bacterium]|jgi:ribonuclease Z|nr:ribonuclease Z [Streptococcaceae bacterium]